MLYSKANLEVRRAASKDKFDRGLTGIRFEADGSTVAGNPRVLVAVGPTDAGKVTWPEDAADETGPGEQGLVMPPGVIDKALRNMSKDKRLSLQHAAMTRVKDAARVGFTVLDAAGNPTTTAALPMRERYPDWRKSIRRIAGSASQDEEGVKGTTRVCVNRRDLLELLKTLEAACPDKGEVSPLFLEIGADGSGLVARTKNHQTGQHVVGACGAYDTRGQWQGRDSWEREVFGSGPKRKKVRRKLK